MATPNKLQITAGWSIIADMFYACTVAVLRKNIWGPSPSSFGRQQRLSEITIKPTKNLGGLGKIWGAWPKYRTATAPVKS